MSREKIRCPKCGTPTKTPHAGKDCWYCHRCQMAFDSSDDGITGYGDPAKIVERQEGYRGRRAFKR